MQIMINSHGAPTAFAHVSGAKPSSGSASTIPDVSCYEGHAAPPACPAPWTPLSPSTCQHFSPHVASHYPRFVNKEQRHAQQAMPVQRPFLSAVPMSVYQQTPVGSFKDASPQRHNGFLSAQHSQNPASFKGSPCVLQSLPPVGVPYGSPAISDTRSRHGNHFSPCMLQPRFSPRTSESIPAISAQMMPYVPSDHSAGANVAGQMSSAMPIKSPHSTLVNMYSNAPPAVASSYTPSSGSQSLNSMMAGTSICTSQNAHAYQTNLTDASNASGQYYAPPPPQSMMHQQQSCQQLQQQRRMQHAQVAQQQHVWQPHARLEVQDWQNGPFVVAARPQPFDEAHASMQPLATRSKRTSSGAVASESSTADHPGREHVHGAQASAQHGQRQNSNEVRSASGNQHVAGGHLGMPMTPAQTLVRYGGTAALTEQEQSEVLNYGHVYYVGANANKHHARPNSREHNRGYDDERGDYKPYVNDHLAYRFEILSILGKGSFGQVLKCFDHKEQVMRAVKIIRNKARFHQQAKMELKILRHLVRKDPGGECNVIHIVDSFEFRGHLCICFELMSQSLYDFMRVHDFKGLNMQLVHKFSVQLIETLRFLAAEGIIHCDLKPENILLQNSSSSQIKVIDFGSSCFRDQCVYTYIQSRFYRSPEVVLGLRYTNCIDMWSLGCMLCELATGKALFPGENEHNQLLLFMELLGPPPTAMTANLLKNTKLNGRIQLDSNGAIKMLPDAQGRTPRPGTRTLSQVLRHQSPAFVDLVANMLVWDPTQRITPDEAARHPWITAPDAPFQPPLPTHSVPESHMPIRRQLSTAAHAGAAHPAPVSNEADASKAASLQAMQMAQQHWERHSFAKAAAQKPENVRRSRKPLAESGNTPPSSAGPEALKRFHTDARYHDGAVQIRREPACSDACLGMPRCSVIQLQPW